MNWLNTNFPNWRTFMAGLIVAVSVAIYDASVNGTLHKSTIGAIIGIALAGYFAKDKNVTGGDVSNKVSTFAGKRDLQSRGLASGGYNDLQPRSTKPPATYQPPPSQGSGGGL